MLRALKSKKGGSSDSASVVSARRSESTRRGRSRSPFRIRGRSRSKSRGRGDKKLSRKASKSVAASSSASHVGIASPEATSGRGRLNSPPSAASTAASTACSSTGSGSSLALSPYDQVDDDIFLRMQTEKYNKMMDSGTSRTQTGATGTKQVSAAAPQDVGHTATGIKTSSNSNNLNTWEEMESNEKLSVVVEDEDDNNDADLSGVHDKAKANKSGRKKVTFGDKTTTNATSPDRYLHAPTAAAAAAVEADKTKSSSSKVTFAGDVSGIGKQKQSLQPGQNRIFLLLLEPNKKIFELCQVEYDAEKATIGQILDLVKAHASESALIEQQYSGLIRPRDQSELTDLKMLAADGGRIRPGEVLIPLPKDCRSSKCRRLAKIILNTPNVAKLLSREEPPSSKPSKRSRSRSRSRRSSKDDASASMKEIRKAALEEASKVATKTLELKIEEIEKRLGATLASSQSEGDVGVAAVDGMSSAELIEQIARDAEETRPSSRARDINPTSFSFESEEMNTVNVISLPRDLVNKSEGPSMLNWFIDTISDQIAIGISTVKPQLRRVRKTAKVMKRRLKRAIREKPMLKAASIISVGLIAIPFLYYLFHAGDQAQMKNTSSYGVALLIGSTLPFLALKHHKKALSRSRNNPSNRLGPKKTKSRMLRGAAIVRSGQASNTESAPRQKISAGGSVRSGTRN